MEDSVGIIAAFGAGVLSFLTPCVLPLLPVYIAFMTGMSVAELTAEDRSLKRILAPVLLFVAGFTVVFVALGASASVLGTFLQANKAILDKAAGVLLVILGVVLLDVLPLPWLRGGGVDASRFRRFGPAAAFVLGLAFPFAMGPCAGPVYGSILTLALRRETVAQGAQLLFVYSLGLALPFVLTSLLLSRLTPLLRWLSRHSRGIHRVAGGLLIVAGVLLLFGQFETIGAWLGRFVPSLE
ncbi:MAG: cytochrome c biogenesis protein CcdA [Coriobacteriia bacterium]|nr:cytochrome c biogenesis protein CcdA [Coriobacteriia bacterium]